MCSRPRNTPLPPARQELLRLLSRSPMANPAGCPRELAGDSEPGFKLFANDLIWDLNITGAGGALFLGFSNGSGRQRALQKVAERWGIPWLARLGGRRRRAASPVAAIGCSTCGSSLFQLPLPWPRASCRSMLGQAPSGREHERQSLVIAKKPAGAPRARSVQALSSTPGIRTDGAGQRPARWEAISPFSSYRNRKRRGRNAGAPPAPLRLCPGRSSS